MLVEVRGVIYPSVKATSEALGITRDAVYSALARGKMDGLGLGHNRRKTIELAGVVFPSISAASKALGFSRSYLRTALTSGSGRVKERVRAAVDLYVNKQKIEPAWQKLGHNT